MTREEKIVVVEKAEKDFFLGKPHFALGGQDGEKYTDSGMSACDFLDSIEAEEDVESEEDLRAEVMDQLGQEFFEVSA